MRRGPACFHSSKHTTLPPPDPTIAARSPNNKASFPRQPINASRGFLSSNQSTAASYVNPRYNGATYFPPSRATSPSVTSRTSTKQLHGAVAGAPEHGPPRGSGKPALVTFPPTSRSMPPSSRVQRKNVKMLRQKGRRPGT